MLHALHDGFLDCGWSAWLCLLFFLPALGAGIAGLMLAKRSPTAARAAGIVAMTVGAFAVATSVLGRQSGISKTMAAVSGAAVDPSQRARIIAVGTDESNQCLKVGAFTGGLPFVLGAMALAMGGAALRKRAPG
jgi:hypothetical protein